MRTSIEGRVALAASEGVVPAVYKDSVGVETWGVGVTAWAIGEQEFGTLNRAMPTDIDGAVALALNLFEKVLRQYERVVNDAVKVPLEQHEYDALVHFCYNIGGPGFKRSKLLAGINRGDKAKAGKTGFHGWLRPPELRGRRDKESDIFLKADYGNSGIPVYGTNGRGKLAGRIKVIPRGEALAMLGGGVPFLPAPQLPDSPPDVHVEGVRTSIWQSTTIRAQLMQWASTYGAGIVAFWNTQDETTKLMIGGFLLIAALAGAWIFKERIRKWTHEGDR